ARRAMRNTAMWCGWKSWRTAGAALRYVSFQRLSKRHSGKSVTDSLHGVQGRVVTLGNECPKLDSSEKCILVVCPSLKSRPYDPRTATRPQVTHAVVRLLQGVRRTEENTGVAHCKRRTDRVSHPGEFLQGEASTK